MDQRKDGKTGNDLPDDSNKFLSGIATDFSQSDVCFLEN